MRERLTLLAPRVGFAALVVAFAVVPVLFTRASAEAFMVPKVTLLAACLLVAAGGVASWTLAARVRPWPVLAVRWPLAALVAWTALATLTSRSRWVSLLGHYGRYDGFLSTLGGVAVVLLLVAYTWRRPTRLDAVAAAVIASGIVGAGYVTIQQLGLDWIRWYNESRNPIERPYGLLGNSNFSGAHLAIVVPFVVVAARRLPHRAARVALWAVAGWLGLCVWWTGTRGGLLALVGGVAVAGLLGPDVIPKAARWASTALTVVALALVLQASTNSVPGQVEGGRPRFLQSSSLADRREIWTAGARMVRDHPLTGVGPDAFGLAFPYYRPPTSIGTSPINADEAHDVFIDRAATAGLPALAAYLWLAGAVALAAWRVRRLLPDDERLLLAAFGGGFGAYVLQGLVSIDVVPLALLGWGTLGALVVLADPGVRVARETLDDRPLVLRTVPLAAMAGVWAVVAALAIVVARPLVADVHYRRGVVATADQRTGGEAAAEFRAALDWHDVEPRYHARLADQLVAIAIREVREPRLRVKLLEEAVIGYRHALDLAPGDAAILRTEARAHVLLADIPSEADHPHLDEAEAIFSDLVHRMPDDVDLHLQYALVLELQASRGQGRAATEARRRALEQFRIVHRRDPGSTAALAGMARVALAEHRYDDAERYLRRALELRPTDAGLVRLLDQVDEARSRD